MTFNIYKFLEFDSDIILSKLELPTRGPLLRNSSQEKFDMSYVIDINDIKIIFLNKEWSRRYQVRCANRFGFCTVETRTLSTSVTSRGAKTSWRHSCLNVRITSLKAKAVHSILTTFVPFVESATGLWVITTRSMNSHGCQNARRICGNVSGWKHEVDHSHFHLGVTCDTAAQLQRKSRASHASTELLPRSAACAHSEPPDDSSETRELREFPGKIKNLFVRGPDTLFVFRTRLLTTLHYLMPRNSLPILEPRNIEDAATIEMTAWRVFVVSICAWMMTKVKKPIQNRKV